MRTINGKEIDHLNDEHYLEVLNVCMTCWRSAKTAFDDPESGSTFDMTVSAKTSLGDICVHFDALVVDEDDEEGDQILMSKIVIFETKQEGVDYFVSTLQELNTDVPDLSPEAWDEFLDED